ncbi:MAG TPA: hypothetical protein VFB38_21820 [Chthonomonadaceae bacterium]|nr:hypothetical protein [Chthonomonadaceae bacterium]
MEEIMHATGIVAIVPARMQSYRLPGKPLLRLGKTTALEQVLRRVRAAQFGANVAVATSEHPSDRPIRELCADIGVPCFTGSPDDVFERVLHAARMVEAQIVAHCTLNNVLLDPKMLDACVRYALDSGMDYVTVSRLPLGTATAAMPLRTLRRAAGLAAESREREQIHAFLSARRDLFEVAQLPPPPRLTCPDLRLALETEEDYRFLSRLYAEVRPRKDGLIHLEDAIAYACPPQEHPSWRAHYRPAAHAA